MALSKKDYSAPRRSSSSRASKKPVKVAWKRGVKSVWPGADPKRSVKSVWKGADPKRSVKSVWKGADPRRSVKSVWKGSLDAYLPGKRSVQGARTQRNKARARRDAKNW